MTAIARPARSKGGPCAAASSRWRWPAWSDTDRGGVSHGPRWQTVWLRDPISRVRRSGMGVVRDAVYTLTYRQEATMVQRVEILLTDDLDSSAISAGTGETVPFALDGLSYEIDLRTRHAAALRAALGPTSRQASRSKTDAAGGSAEAQ